MGRRCLKLWQAVSKLLQQPTASAAMDTRGYVMKVDDAGLEFIRSWEGCELDPYLDQAGYLTVGVGHLLSGEDDPWNKTITVDEADYLLSGDVQPPEEVIMEEVQVEIHQNHFNALASLIFNIGTGAFRDSTLLRVLNEGDYMGAADQFLVWNKITVDGEKVASQGLTNRREAERTLFLTSVKKPAPITADELHEHIASAVMFGSKVKRFNQLQQRLHELVDKCHEDSQITMEYPE